MELHRELDISIARLLFGCSPIGTDFVWCGCKNVEHGEPSIGFLFNYSTNQRYLWQIVERIREFGYNVMIERMDEVRVTLWAKNLNEHGPAPIRKSSESVMFSLCSAAIEIDTLLHDGFGNSTSKVCPNCHKVAMQVVRPGVFQCSECE